MILGSGDIGLIMAQMCIRDSLCAVLFDLPKCLSSALWDEQKPAILTSGTLAVGCLLYTSLQSHGSVAYRLAKKIQARIILA